MPEEMENKKEEIKSEEISTEKQSDCHKKRLCCPLTGNPIYWAQIAFGLILGLVIGLSMPTILVNLAPVLNPEQNISGLPHDLSETHSWFEGAKGYEEALLVQKENGKPIFLYFYAPWCSYCAKFNGGLVNQKEIQDYLEQNFISVRVYPDTEEADFLLFRQYNASGYPTVFLKMPTAEADLNGVTKVDAFKATPAGWAMKSPKEFMAYLDGLALLKDETALKTDLK